MGWVVGISPIDSSRVLDFGGSALRGGGIFPKDPSPYLREFRRKIAEKSERLRSIGATGG